VVDCAGEEVVLVEVSEVVDEEDVEVVVDLRVLEVVVSPAGVASMVRMTRSDQHRYMLFMGVPGQMYVMHSPMDAVILGHVSATVSLSHDPGSRQGLTSIPSVGQWCHISRSGRPGSPSRR